MNKKGFVLMETIVVIVVISVALLSIFASYNKIMTKVKTENKYDTSEYIYATYHVKKYLAGISISVQDIALLNASNNVKNYKNKLPLNPYGISYIYLLTNLNEADKDNLKYFDAYMIDYIKKLDVKDTDQLIIVEYKRPARDENYEELVDSSGKSLYETYIASLEW